MTWQLTYSLAEFERVAGEHLRADPVRQTVPLTVLASLALNGDAAFGDSPPAFAWHQQPDGTVDGAVLRTPPFPLLAASFPTGSARALLDALSAAGGLPDAVNVARTDEASVLGAWAELTGGTGIARMRSCLYRLGQLTPAEPAPPGAARVAGPADVRLLVDWHDAFHAEAGGFAEDSARIVADRLGHAGLMLWEVRAEPVAMAGITREVAGVVRVAGVYTPLEHRRYGYGGAITAAASQAALAAGASEVVLVTDLANPTSNALYQRLGFEPIEHRVVLDLAGGGSPPGLSGQRHDG